MAQPAANLRVRISADLADIKQGLGLLRGELAKVKAQAATALPGNNNAFVSGIRRARMELASFVGVYLSLRGVSVLGGIADEATLIRSRIKNAKGDYEALLALAQETRSGLNATADLYTKVERSTRGQLKNQGDLLILTKAVNQAIKISGAGPAQAEAAVLQLGQALASGKLAGDELRSLAENAPRLGEAIAAGMGKAQGSLKKLGEQGKLTTDVVVKALVSQAAVLENEYKKIPITIGDSFTILRNSLLDYIGDQDAATGASRKFAEAVKQFAVDLPKYLNPLLTVVGLLLKNFDALAVFFITRMAAAAIPAIINGFVALRAAIIATTASAVTLRGALALLGGPIGIAIAALAAGIYYLYQRTQQAKVAAEEHTTALEANKNMAYQSAAAASAEAKAKREQALRTLQAAQAILAEKQARMLAANDRANLIVGEGRANSTGRDAAVARSQAQQAQEAVASAKKEFDDWGRRLVELAMQANDEVLNSTTSAVATATEATGKAVAASNALLRDSISRALAELDRLYEAHEIGIGEYFAARKELQEQAIDAEIAQSRAELAVTKEVGQRRKIEEDIIKLQRDRAEIAVVGAHAQKAAEEELAKQLGDVKIRLLELDGETERAARAQLEGEFLELFKRLEAASDETGKAMVRNLIDRLVDKARLDQIKEAADKINGTLQGSETSISAQASAGMLGGLESERQLQAARELALGKLRELRQATLEYLEAQAPDSPAAINARATLQGLNTDIANIIASQNQWRQDVEDAGQSSLMTFFNDLKEGAMSAGEAVRALASNFANALFQMAAAAVSKRIVGAISSLFGGGADTGDVAAGAAKLQTAAGETALAGGVIVFGASSLSNAAKELQAAATTLLIANGVSSFGAAHGGGTVGALTMMRHKIPNSVFAAAPRYHSGGVAGLRPGEVPAILEEGERIRTKEQEANLQRQLAASAGGQVTTPIVAIGDQAVADAMATAAGEKVVLTIVRRNWGGLNRGGNV